MEGETISCHLSEAAELNVQMVSDCCCYTQLQNTRKLFKLEWFSPPHSEFKN